MQNSQTDCAKAMIGACQNFLFINTVNHGSPHTWLVHVGTSFPAHRHTWVWGIR